MLLYLHSPSQHIGHPAATLYQWLSSIMANLPAHALLPSPSPSHLLLFPCPLPGVQVRRLLLHAVLLCSAALEDQVEEVEHYLNQPYLSPNALGLRHKSALHLASVAGHTGIVKLLIERGVSGD